MNPGDPIFEARIQLVGVIVRLNQVAEWLAVHLLISDDNSRAFTVKHVAWTDDHPEHPGWHAEISLS